MSLIVIDPGHGGTRDQGGSSALGCLGPSGTCEKQVSLQLAERVRRFLPRSIQAQLTRDGDVNLPLETRARKARSAGADLFISIHANAGARGERGVETFVHPRAGSASHALARSLQRALSVGSRDRGLKSADLTILRPELLGEDTAACLVEVDFLSDPQGEARLLDSRELDALARSMASALAAHARKRRGYGLPVGSGAEETDAPMLASHLSPNAALRWNVQPMSVACVDLLLHFHGAGITTIKAKADRGGLDFNDPAAATRDDPPLRDRPTLGLAPAGLPVAASLNVDFSAVARDAAALDAFTNWGLDRFATTQLSQPAGSLSGAGQRFIASAHSAGGQALEAVLHYADPHEVEMFDCTYYGVANAARWVLSRLRRDAAALAPMGSEEAWRQYMRTDGGSLRCLFTAGRTAPSSTKLHHIISCALQTLTDPGLAAFLGRYYRVERTEVGHPAIPHTFGWQLLVDPSQELTPAPVELPPSTHCASLLAPERANLSQAAALPALGSPRRGQPALGLDHNDDVAFILDTGRSGLDRIASAARREHFLNGVDWSQQFFPGRGPDRASESEAKALFAAMAQVCHERRVPRMVTYRDVSAEVVAVPGQRPARLWPAASAAFVRMARAAEADGVRLSIGDSYRTAEEQEEKRRRNHNPNAVAQGNSAHMYGLAVDLVLSTPALPVRPQGTRSMELMVRMYRTPAYKWMLLNAALFGFYPYSMESWHWEYNPDGLAAQFAGNAS